MYQLVKPLCRGERNNFLPGKGYPLLYWDRQLVQQMNNDNIGEDFSHTILKTKIVSFQLPDEGTCLLCSELLSFHHWKTAGEQKLTTPTVLSSEALILHFCAITRRSCKCDECVIKLISSIVMLQMKAIFFGFNSTSQRQRNPA